MYFVKIVYEQDTEWVYLNVDQICEVQVSREGEKMCARILYSNGESRVLCGSRGEAVSEFLSPICRELRSPADQQL